VHRTGESRRRVAPREVNEDLIDEPCLEAPTDDIRTEHEHVAAAGSLKRGREGVPDITGHECVRGVGLVGRRRVGEDELWSAPTSAEQPTHLGSLQTPADVIRVGRPGEPQFSR
jgi:hypothetical protein